MSSKEPAGNADFGFVNRRPKVLVVDDQPANIRAVNALLHDDCDILIATGGVRAVELCRMTAPDLVLLDVVMPDLDGREVLRRLRSDPATADIPVIFITARDDDEAEAAGLELGAADYITKPIRPAILLARVRTQLLLKAQADRLRELAAVDGLTGVANRRRFDERLRHEREKALRTGASLAVGILDIDFFKRYNDRYGHIAGDDCLKQVAGTLRGEVERAGGFFARQGGEEFAFLIPGVSAAETRATAERMIESVRELDIPHAASPIAPYVTVSLGAIVVPAMTGDKASRLMEEADKLLYWAKNQGRNRAEVG